MSIRQIAVFFFLVTAAYAQVRTPLLPLKIKNGTDIARTNERVSVSVPFPDNYPVYSAAALCITTGQENQPVAHQAKVLSRWGGDRTDTSKPLKWVQFMFAATVPANGEATYQVSSGLGIPGQLYAQQDMNEIRIFTGPNSWFKIPRLTFAPFKEAVVNGVTVVNQPGGLSMRYINGSVPAAFPTSTTIEDYVGYQSVRVNVVQKGWIGALAYTCRWYFQAGSNEVEMQFRLENPAAYGCFSSTIPDGQQYFDKLAIVQPIAGSGFRVATPTGITNLQPGQSFDVRQEFTTATNPTNLTTGFLFTEQLAGTVTSTGNKHSGTVDVSTASMGLTVAVDRFWQNHPKTLKVLNGSVEVGLWPDFGHGPEYRGVYATPTSTSIPVDPNALAGYRFEGGRWKNHRMNWAFHTGPATTTSVTSVSKRTAAPLAGVAPGWYIRRTGAMGTLWKERVASSEVSWNRFEQFNNLLGDDQAADDMPNYGKVGLRAFLNRGGTYGYHHPYGWANFGDIPWSDGFSSLHYDWPAITWNAWLRSGDYASYDVARDLHEYRRDYGQSHSKDPAESFRGGQFYEKGWWHGNYSFPYASHNWIEGLLIGYILTGDEASREAAIENIEFVLRIPPGNWDGLYGSRIAGWGIDNLVAAYNFLGNQSYLLAAEAGIARFEQIEIQQGAHGYVLNAGDQNTAKPWMDATVFVGAAKYTMASHSARFLPLLDRMKTALKTQFCILPSGPLTAWDIPKVWYQWSPVTGGSEKSVLFDWWVSAVFAYSAAIFNSAEDLAWSEMYFETAIRYWQLGPTVTSVNTNDPSSYSKMSMKMLMFPESESKAVGHSLIWGQSYLAIKTWFNGQW